MLNASRWQLGERPLSAASILQRFAGDFRRAEKGGHDGGLAFSSGLGIVLRNASPARERPARLSSLRKKCFGSIQGAAGVCRVWSQLYDDPRVAHIGPAWQSG